jgi:hypothetical protein
MLFLLPLISLPYTFQSFPIRTLIILLAILSLAGSIASGIGIPDTLLICGLVTLASGIWFAMSLKSFRKFVHPI